MEAIILAGGFGTRLAHIVSDVPKPMAPVAGKPFLEYILRQIADQGVTRAVLAVGYKAECIQSFFGHSFENRLELVYSREDQPLLTGGAIRKALDRCLAQDVYIINGDTFFDVDFAGMQRLHQTAGAVLTIAVRKMYDFTRYGTVETDTNGRILRFLEKRPCSEGWINGGVYLLRREALAEVREVRFSFETDYMERFVAQKPFFAFPSEGYFIDIGVPEDYYRAQEDFKAHA